MHFTNARDMIHGILGAVKRPSPRRHPRRNLISRFLYTHRLPGATMCGRPPPPVACPRAPSASASASAASGKLRRIRGRATARYVLYATDRAAVAHACGYPLAIFRASREVSTTHIGGGRAGGPHYEYLMGQEVDRTYSGTKYIDLCCRQLQSDQEKGFTT